MQAHKALRYLFTALVLFWATATLADDDSIYYAQHTFFAPKSVHQTTNYHVGVMVPINSRIKVTKSGRKKMTIELLDLDNAEIKIVNAKKHTQKNMDEIKARMFGTSKVDLSKYSSDVQDAIMNGQLILGMTKEEAILAYGYPPAHVTPNTSLNQWTYWNTRWNRIVVDFKDDKITGIRD